MRPSRSLSVKYVLPSNVRHPDISPSTRTDEGNWPRSAVFILRHNSPTEMAGASKRLRIMVTELEQAYLRATAMARVHRSAPRRVSAIPVARTAPRQRLARLPRPVEGTCAEH